MDTFPLPFTRTYSQQNSNKILLPILYLEVPLSHSVTLTCSYHRLLIKEEFRLQSTHITKFPSSTPSSLGQIINILRLLLLLLAQQKSENPRAENPRRTTIIRPSLNHLSPFFSAKNTFSSSAAVCTGWMDAWVSREVFVGILAPTRMNHRAQEILHPNNMIMTMNCSPTANS